MRYFIFPLLLINSHAVNFDDFKLSGYLRSVYVKDDRKGLKIDQSTFGIGGKVAIESNYIWNTKAKLGVYTTQDLGINSENPKTIDGCMFDVNKKPYTILGEAFIENRTSNTTFRFGRQEIETPIVDMDDFRIIPNLFEAYRVINNDVPNTTLTFAYITKVSGVDGLISFDFKSVGEQTYSSLALNSNLEVDNSEAIFNISKVSGKSSIVMIGSEIDIKPKIRLYNYYVKDILNIFYIDGVYEKSIKDNLSLKIELQDYYVKDIGKYSDFLTKLGLNGEYNLFGIKTSIKTHNITPSIAYNEFSGDEKSVTVYGTYGAYPELASTPYLSAQDDSVSSIPKSKTTKVAIKFDFLETHNFTAGYGYTDIYEKILPNSDMGVTTFLYKAKFNKSISFKALAELRESNNYRYDNNQYTFTLNYMF